MCNFMRYIKKAENGNTETYCMYTMEPGPMAVVWFYFNKDVLVQVNICKLVQFLSLWTTISQ
jgi:hypothetical protein